MLISILITMQTTRCSYHSADDDGQDTHTETRPSRRRQRLRAAPGLFVAPAESYTVSQADINNVILHTDTCCNPGLTRWCSAAKGAAMVEKEKRKESLSLKVRLTEKEKGLLTDLRKERLHIKHKALLGLNFHRTTITKLLIFNYQTKHHQRYSSQNHTKHFYGY